MSETAKLKIALSECGMGTVTLNGMDIGHCTTGIEFKSKVGDLTEVRLTIFADVDAEVVAKLDRIALCKIEPQKPASPGVRLLNGQTLNVRPRG